MEIAFDLVSDLHVDTWDQEFDWTGRATSPYCILAGDVCADRLLLYKTLRHLGQCYRAVFYIDGNDEHVNFYDHLGASYEDLTDTIANIPNVVYLQDNLVVIDGVAILGTNGWWGFDFDKSISVEQTQQWWCNTYCLTHDNFKIIRKANTIDANYMIASTKRVQTHQDVKKIIMVTHTVPMPELIQHDIELSGHYKFNVMGNQHMANALLMDSENKIHTWCFGHYHGKVDQQRHGIRWVNNCRGKGNTPWSQYVYHPLRIEINL